MIKHPQVHFILTVNLRLLKKSLHWHPLISKKWLLSNLSFQKQRWQKVKNSSVRGCHLDEAPNSQDWFAIKCTLAKREILPSQISEVQELIKMHYENLRTFFSLLCTDVWMFLPILNCLLKPLGFMKQTLATFLEPHSTKIRC